jgi:hypothetical protein
MLSRLSLKFGVLAFVACVGIASSAWATNPVTKEWDEMEAARAAELAQKAERNHANLRLFARAISFAAAGVLGWVAVAVARRGFGFGAPGRRWQGPPAWIAAAILGTACVAFGVIGARYPDTFIPAKEQPLPVQRAR